MLLADGETFFFHLNNEMDEGYQMQGSSCST